VLFRSDAVKLIVSGGAVMTAAELAKIRAEQKILAAEGGES